MKISRLLVLSALWATTMSVNAAVDLIDREKPTFDVVEETPVAFEVGKNYILYNTGAQAYFTQGSTWGTRGCVVPNKKSAVMVRVAQYKVNDAWDNKTYEIENYVTPRTGNYSWYKMCMNAAGDLYLDQTTWSRFVEIPSVGDKVYRIMPSQENSKVTGDNGGVVSDGSQFVGYANLEWDGGGTQYDFGNGDNEDRKPLSALTTENVDWVFYSTAAYDAAVEVFNKAEELRALIIQADEAGNVDASAINAAAEVYNNIDATLGDITGAISAIGQAIAAASGVTVTGSADNPGDATALLTNPNFDDASAEGWLGTAPNMVGSGSHGPANVAEHYNKTFDTYQSLYGMPAGVYGLSAYTFYRGSWDDYQNGTNKNAVLYADGDDSQKSAFANPWEAQNTTPMAGKTDFGTTAGETSHEDNGVTYYIPNDPSAGRVYFEQGFYYNAVAFGVTAGSAKVGVKKEVAVGNDWSVFDTFALKYYGNEGAASWGSWLADNASKLYATNATATRSYVEDFESAVDGLKSNANDATSANAAFESAKSLEELAVLKENIALWGQYKAALAEAEVDVQKYPATSGAGDVADMIKDGEDDIEDMMLTNDEIRQAIADLKQAVEAMIEEAKNQIVPGTDVSDLYLHNVDFAQGAEGWIKEKDSRPGIAFSQGIAEAYNTDFDMYQEVQGPQVGVYELQLQGFFRMERDATAYNKYLAGEQVTTAGVYMNTNKTILKCIFDEGLAIGSEDESGKSGSWMNNDDTALATGYNYPNDMTSAAYAFGLKDEQGNGKYYMNKAYGLVAEAGETLRVGVSGDVRGNNWICFDNFKLVYKGFDAQVIKPILDEAAAGLNVDQKMGKSIHDDAVAAKNAAQSAGDGTAMFNALKNLFDLRERIAESVALFKTLNEAAEDLNSTTNWPEVANTTGMFDAQELVGEIQNGMRQYSYEDEDVPGLMNRIKAARTKLFMPMEEPDANGVDVTCVIRSSGFGDGPEEDGANTVAGWNAEGYNFGNDDTQKAALALEFYNKTFDLSQEILGLEDGIYEITVNAFCRIGNTDEDFVAFAANPDATQAYLYGISGGVTSSKPIPCIAKGAYDADMGIGGGTFVDDNTGTTYYIPGDMVSAVAFFAQEDTKYVQTVTVEVKDGQLLMGIMKKENKDNGWVLMDTFKMKYFGKNSGKQADGDSMGIEEIAGNSDVKKVELFTIDGRKAGNQTKGLVILRQTMNNGQVIVKKIQK